MGKTFHTPQGICISKFRLKYDGGTQFFHQSRLPGNAEFRCKIAVHPGDHLNFYIFHSR